MIKTPSYIRLWLLHAMGALLVGCMATPDQPSSSESNSSFSQGLSSQSSQASSVSVQDTDNDGVLDPQDRCVTEAGVPENGGCPVPRTELSDIEQQGKDLLDAQCAACHSELGDGGLKDLRPAVRDGSFNAITVATMPKSPLGTPTDCTDDCAVKIAAYLTFIHDIELIIDDEPVPAMPEQPVVVKAINVGSEMGYESTSANILFESDQFVTGGTATNAPEHPVQNTTDDALFSSERYGDFNYEIPLNNGQYLVELWLNELFNEGAGQRVFHFEAEGTRFLENFDLFATTGGKDIAHITNRFVVDVNDGILNLDFITVNDNATASGIVIYRIPTVADKYVTHCQGCHGTPQGELVTFGGALVKSDCEACSSLSVLTDYIEARMPYEYAQTCRGECASDFASYIFENFAGFNGIPDVEVIKPVPIAGDIEACGNGTDAGFSGLIRLSRTQYQHALRDIFNAQNNYTTSFGLDGTVGNFFINSAAAASELQVEQYMEVAERLTENAVTYLESWLACDARNDACADKLIDEVGIKFYRRPLSSDEKTRLKAVYTQAKTFNNSVDEGLRYLLQAFLSSPHFLYQMELNLANPVGDDVVVLSQYEVAARLASFLWRSIPDSELFAAAANNQLSTPAQIKAQAERMLADPKAKVAVGIFHKEWMKALDPDSADDELAAKVAGIEDLKRTVNEVIFTDNGTMQDLYSVDYGFLNDAGKVLYGVTGEPIATTDDGFGKYMLDAQKRGGILTRGAFLHSNTPPSGRGKFIRQEVLCGVIPPPPAGVPEVPEGDGNSSPRERWNLHVTNPSCGGCHKLMDPLGFAFDHYDLLGHWQDEVEDHGKFWPIDDSGEIFATSDINQQFEGANQLQGLLASSVDTKACYSYQWFRFATGRNPTHADSCSLAKAIEFADQQGGSIQDIMISITQTDAFRHRRTQSK